MLRRTYAFESDCPENVKGELEKVEAAVDEKCASAEDCDKVLAKIDDQAEKFDDALKSMANAAKDAKAGGDQAAATASIKEAQADLKQVAKTIGVANESDSEYADRTEIEDAKAYLEGAREIVEAKKDELSDGGSGDKGSCDDGECDDDANEACEAWLDAYSDALADALESEIYDGIAMEGATSDGAAIFWSKHKELTAMKKEMNAAKMTKDWKTAAAKARECAKIGGEMESAVNSLPQDLKATVLVKIAMAVAAALAGAAIGHAAGKFKGTHSQHFADGTAAATRYKMKQEHYETYKRKQDAARMGHAAQSALNARDAKAAAITKAGTITGTSAGLGAVAGSSAAAALLKKKNVVDENGNTHSERLSPNDHNTILNLIKADAKRIQKAYTKKAEEFDKKASAGSESGESSDATESFIATMESLMITPEFVADDVLECMLGEMDDDAAEAAIESFAEETSDEIQTAMESDLLEAAMEGANTQGLAIFTSKHKELNAKRKEMNAAKMTKDWKTAAAKARECAKIGGEMESAINALPNDVGAAVLIRVAIAIASILASAAAGHIAGKYKATHSQHFADGTAAATRYKMKQEHYETYKRKQDAARMGHAAQSALNARDAKVAKTTAAATNAGLTLAGGVVGGATALSLLKKKNVVDENGNTHSERLGANDHNTILNAIKADAKRIQKAYTKKAEEFDKKASAGGGEGGSEPAAESWLLA